MIDHKLLKRLIMPLRRAHGRLAMSVGRVRSADPLCKGFGYSRGTPIDRYYIERFLAELLDVFQFLAIFEKTVFLAMSDDVFRKHGTDA